MELTREQQVDQIIRQIMDEQGISQEAGRAQLHKFVCGGGCDWYKTKSKQAGFDRLSLPEEQRKSIQRIVEQVMKGLTEEEARAEIHKVLCP